MGEKISVPPLYLEETVEALALGLCDAEKPMLHLLLSVDGERSGEQDSCHIHLIFDRTVEPDADFLDRTVPMSVFVYADGGSSTVRTDSLIPYPITLNNGEDWPALVTKRIAREIQKADIASPSISIVFAELFSGSIYRVGTDTKDSGRDMYRVRVDRGAPSVPSMSASSTDKENPKATVQIECAPDLT